LFLFCIFSCFCFVFCIWFGSQGSASAIGLPVATADAAIVAFVALASAAWRTIAAAIWPDCATVRLRVLFEQQHVFVQCVKLAVNLCDDWLNE